MHIKTTAGYPYTLIRMTWREKKWVTTNVGKDVKRWGHQIIHCQLRDAKWYSRSRKTAQQKLNIQLPLRPRSCAPRHLSQSSKDLYSHKNLYTNDYSSFIHHSQKLDQTSFNGCSNKRTATHPCHGILFGNRKRQRKCINTGNSVDGSTKNYTEFKKKNQSQKMTYLQFWFTTFWKGPKVWNREQISGCRVKGKVRGSGFGCKKPNKRGDLVWWKCSVSMLVVILFSVLQDIMKLGKGTWILSITYNLHVNLQISQNKKFN